MMFQSMMDHVQEGVPYEYNGADKPLSPNIMVIHDTWYHDTMIHGNTW